MVTVELLQWRLQYKTTVTHAHTVILLLYVNIADLSFRELFCLSANEYNENMFGSRTGWLYYKTLPVHVPHSGVCVATRLACCVDYSRKC